MEPLKLVRELTEAQDRGLETQEPALSHTRWPGVMQQAVVRYPPYRAQASWSKARLCLSQRSRRGPLSAYLPQKHRKGFLGWLGSNSRQSSKHHLLDQDECLAFE